MDPGYCKALVSISILKVRSLLKKFSRAHSIASAF